MELQPDQQDQIGHSHGAVSNVAETLIAKANANEWPEHQYMDAPTLAWIASHRPSSPTAAAPLPQLRPVAQRLMAAAPIPRHWHAEPKIISSIHGTRHLLRTTALALLLAELHGLDDVSTSTLAVAAATHDCRRVHDNNDIGHGTRAATWLISNATEVFSHFNLEDGTDEAGHAATAVRLHDLPYTYFSEDDITDHARTERITDLLKTADALDRYRIPKHAWWPRHEYLRVIPPPWLHRFAFELVLATEAACLEGSDSATAVLSELESSGIC